MKNANSDLFAALIGLGLTALFWFNKGNAGFMSLNFPKAIMLMMLVISLALLLKAFIRAERADLFIDLKLDRILVVTIALFAWVFAMKWFGFIVTTVTVFAFLVYYLARTTRKVGFLDMARWMVVIVIEVGVLYWVFSKVLYVPLPKGMFI